jgi:hypothetical protein
MSAKGLEAEGGIGNLPAGPDEYHFRFRSTPSTFEGGLPAYQEMASGCLAVLGDLVGGPPWNFGALTGRWDRA